MNSNLVNIAGTQITTILIPAIKRLKSEYPELIHSVFPEAELWLAFHALKDSDSFFESACSE